MYAGSNLPQISSHKTRRPRFYLCLCNRVDLPDTVFLQYFYIVQKAGLGRYLLGFIYNAYFFKQVFISASTFHRI